MGTEDAHAAFRRFDEAVANEPLRAAAAAFAYVACADGELADAEVERFASWAREEPSFHVDDEATLATSFRALASAFATDLATAQELAVRAAQSVSGDAAARGLVLAAARVAVVADLKLEPVEEAAMERLCRALGVDPDEW